MASSSRATCMRLRQQLRACRHSPHWSEPQQHTMARAWALHLHAAQRTHHVHIRCTTLQLQQHTHCAVLPSKESPGLQMGSAVGAAAVALSPCRSGTCAKVPEPPELCRVVTCATPCVTLVPK